MGAKKAMRRGMDYAVSPVECMPMRGTVSMSARVTAKSLR